jgi:hypothetical protein
LGDLTDIQQSENVRVTNEAEDVTLALGSDGSANVNEGATTSGITEKKTITTEVEASAGASPLANRKTILIQAIDNSVMLGFASGKLYHEITKGNWFEAKISASVPLYIKADSGSVEVVISELA